jgi:hypothetical protein
MNVKQRVMTATQMQNVSIRKDHIPVSVSQGMTEMGLLIVSVSSNITIAQ